MGRKKNEPTDGAPKPPRVMRIDKAYFLSENDKGTLDGTEWMTRAAYAAAQAKARYELGEAGLNRGFATSSEAVAYRAKCGLLDAKVEYGLNLVKEYVGERPERNPDPNKPPKPKKEKVIKVKKKKLVKRKPKKVLKPKKKVSKVAVTK